ncbi:hypothetical protein G4B84_011712 [Aspergillus flavus NRRL3357]|nr:uncharacterized protein G4B84_011712 [Aspergillus flavus NRRL3357]QMW36183.1 hypothetical protein G4B84_011712 [Aspergillus flavus NRRL3357]
MSSTDAGLGNFAILPPELRLCIWDWLFPRHIIGPLKGPPIFKRRRTRLAILRTSKELYAEISHHLYSRISVSIRLNPQKRQWLSFRIPELRLSWLIEEKEDAIQRGYDTFPFHKVPIYIGIHPPNPASLGDLFRLWQNVRSLINILVHAPSIESVHITSYCSPILFSRLPISMTTPSAVSYQALAGEIIRRELALEVTVFLQVIAEATWSIKSIFQNPPGKSAMALPFDTFNEDLRVENKVAAMTVARSRQAFQDYDFPDTVKGLGGLAFNADGNVCAGPPSFQVVGGPFSSHADFYRGLLDWQLSASDRYELINGWRTSGLRDRLDRCVAEGLDGVLSKLPTGRPTFVQASLELLKTLYDPDTLHITDLLVSHISILVTEYLHSSHSISGALTVPYSEETGDLREAILHGFPDAENLPTSKPMRQGPAEFGSDRDIQWDLAKVWNDELVNVGALRSPTIDGADDFSRVHWFIEDLAPRHLFDAAVVEIWTPEQLEEARKEVEATLGKYLDGWGF